MHVDCVPLELIPVVEHYPTCRAFSSWLHRHLETMTRIGKYMSTPHIHHDILFWVRWGHIVITEMKRQTALQRRTKRKLVGWWSGPGFHLENWRLSVWLRSVTHTTIRIDGHILITTISIAYFRGIPLQKNVRPIDFGRKPSLWRCDSMKNLEVVHVYHHRFWLGSPLYIIRHVTQLHHYPKRSNVRGVEFALQAWRVKPENKITLTILAILGTHIIISFLSLWYCLKLMSCPFITVLERLLDPFNILVMTSVSLILCWRIHQIYRQCSLSTQHQQIWCTTSALIQWRPVGTLEVRQMLIPVILFLIYHLLDMLRELEFININSLWIGLLWWQGHSNTCHWLTRGHMSVPL